MKPPSIPKAIGAGCACGAAAVLAWLCVAFWPHLFILPYVVALAATALCGAYILIATGYDLYRHPRRGARVRPIRGFDVAAGLVLTAPALLALYPFLPAL